MMPQTARQPGGGGRLSGRWERAGTLIRRAWRRQRHLGLAEGSPFVEPRLRERFCPRPKGGPLPGAPHRGVGPALKIAGPHRRMHPRDESESRRLRDEEGCADDDLRKVWTADEIAKGDHIVFVATGISDSTLLRGIRYQNHHCPDSAYSSSKIHQVDGEH